MSNDFLFSRETWRIPAAQVPRTYKTCSERFENLRRATAHSCAEVMITNNGSQSFLIGYHIRRKKHARGRGMERALLIAQNAQVVPPLKLGFPKRKSTIVIHIAE